MPLLVVPLLIGSAEALPSQTALPLDSGARVRVWSSDPRLTQRVGTVASLQTDTLRLSLDRDAWAGDTLRSVAVSMVNVTRLDVSHGRYSQERSMIRGALVGLIVFGSLGYLMSSPCPPSEWCFIDRKEFVKFSAVVGTLVGGVIGALVPPGEKWERLRSEHR